VAQGRTPEATRLAASLWRFWQMRGHLHEGRGRIDQVLAMPGSAEDPAARKRLLEAAGGLAYWQAVMEAAQVYYEEAVELARALGDPRDLASALYNLAFPSLVGARDLDRSRALLDEATALFRRLDDRAGIALSQWAIGTYDLLKRDFPAAVAHYDESRDIFRSLDRRFDLGWALRMRALTAIAMRDAAIARSQAGEALKLFVEAHDVSGMVMLVADFAGIVTLEGDPARAIALREAAAVHRASTGSLLWVASETHIDWPEIPRLAAVEEEAAAARGRAMTLEDAVALALEPARTSSA
jgi:tetratricopeptide (TPR) repeat protein